MKPEPRRAKPHGETCVRLSEELQASLSLCLSFFIMELRKVRKKMSVYKMTVSESVWKTTQAEVG